MNARWAKLASLLLGVGLFSAAFFGAFRGARALSRAAAAPQPEFRAVVEPLVAPRLGPEFRFNAPLASTESLPEDQRAALERIGKHAFFDPNLSEPAGTSCASCHDPARGFAGENGSPTGVALGSRAGHFARRNTPSVLYLKFVRPFHFRWEEDAPLPDAVGGFFWDGRSDSLAQLVAQPLLNLDEMGNANAAALSAKVRAVYAQELGATLPGEAEPDSLLALGRALEAYLLSDAMAPFSSKYDDFARGRVALSAPEAAGLALFKDPDKGNCASCHKLNDKISDPRRSLFTDYGFEAVGVPRNRELGARPADLGLCERREPAQAAEPRFCGSFRTPSLRNVALRSSYMHNGAFKKLRDVVAFYATRGTNPARWYPGAIASDDLPPRYRENVNTSVSPYDRGPGETARLNDTEIDAITAFLQTLTDARLPRVP